MSPDPAAAPLSGLLVYVSSALSTPHLVYFPAQTPLPGAGRKLQLQPSSNLRQSAGLRKLHFPLGPPPGCLTSCMRRDAVQTRSCTLASHLPTFKVGGWGERMQGSSISRASVKFEAGRGLGTVRGGRSLRVSCSVRSVVPSQDSLKVWPKIAGELGPSKRPQIHKCAIAT